jgi:hypothetical protein
MPKHTVRKFTIHTGEKQLEMVWFGSPIKMGEDKMISERRTFVNFRKDGDHIFAMVALADDELIQLADGDYQSLIDTIEKIWPNWFDVDQYLTSRGLS